MTEYRLTPDGVQARRMTKDELGLLQAAEARLTHVRVPRFLDTPADRVFVAAMDGTGNNFYKDAAENLTVVALLKEQVEHALHPQLKVGYVAGVGTQDDAVVRGVDGALALTFRNRVEQVYLEFCTQAALWLEEEPQARIRLAGVGFSRGAEGVAALQRLVHERGIRDPVGAVSDYGPDGILERITWAELPPLVPPGRTVQAALLLDPVATSLREHDRRLPASNVSTLQITSLQEPRDHFPGTLHAPPGLTEAGTVANLMVGGAHSDIGGAYTLDGVGRRVHNMGVDYFNGLFGERLLEQVPVAHDPRMFVVHRSDQHKGGLWPTGEWERTGERGMHTDLAPACVRLEPAPCHRDPVDHRLAAGLEWRHVVRGRPPGGTDARLERAQEAIGRMYQRFPDAMDRTAARAGMPGSAELLSAREHVRGLFERLAEAAVARDDAAMSAAARAYASTPAGALLMPGLAVAQAWGAKQHAAPPAHALQP